METKTIEFDEWIHTGVVSHWAPGHVGLVHPPVEGVGICPTVPWLSRIHDLDIPNYHTKILMFRILVLSSLTCWSHLKVYTTEQLQPSVNPEVCFPISMFISSILEQYRKWKKLTVPWNQKNVSSTLQHPPGCDHVVARDLESIGLQSQVTCRCICWAIQ